MHIKSILTSTALLISSIFSTAAHAVTYKGIEFPAGDISFADSVVSYTPSFGGGNVPTDTNYTDPSKALGAPDYQSPNGSVSLGDGGRIILEFVDNFLTGSSLTGVADGIFDLHIFEIGGAVEATDVHISKDGSVWESVGRVNGSVSSIDIDLFGFSVSDQFRFVQLTDVKGLNGTTGSTVGADIDAVGAISTVINPNPGTSPVPDSGSSFLAFLISLAGIVAFTKRKR